MIVHHINQERLQCGRKNSLYLSLSVALLSLATITTGGLLASSHTIAKYHVSAEDTSVVDQINIAVPVSCTISGTGMNSHNADINNGLYEDDIGSTILHAFCNDNEGFAIYAAGYTGNEIGATNSNKLVGTSASNNAVIASGLATTAGNPDISNWAMKLAISQDSGDTTGTNAFTIDSAPNVDLPSEAESGATQASFSSYHVVPNEYVKVAHKNSMTDMTATTGGVKLTTTYAAYISKTQAADTYTGQVIYTLVHPASHAAPVFLNPNATDISDVIYMQQFAIVGDVNRQSIIDSMVPEQQYTMIDMRDNKTYTIAKYQTGTDSTTSQPIYDVWMTKNLDLDIDGSRTYTNEDTDLGYNTTTNSYDTASWTPVRSTYTPTSDHIHAWCQGGTWSTQYGFCENNDTPESYNPGDLYWNLTESDWSDWFNYYNSCDYTTSTPTCDQSKNPISTYVSSTGTEQYHLGNYYNWAAALATNDSSAYIDEQFTGEVLVEQSICPAGWTLPRIGGGEDTFYSLWDQYGFSSNSYNDTNNNRIHDANERALWTSLLYFAANGYFDGNLGNVGHDGYFWAPVPDGSLGARIAYFNVDGYADPSDYGNRGYGNSVRCILRPVVNSVSGGGGGVN